VNFVGHKAVETPAHEYKFSSRIMLRSLTLSSAEPCNGGERQWRLCSCLLAVEKTIASVKLGKTVAKLETTWWRGQRTPASSLASWYSCAASFPLYFFVLPKTLIQNCARIGIQTPRSSLPKMIPNNKASS
jgi:hypothetical protein